MRTFITILAVAIVASTLRPTSSTEASRSFSVRDSNIPGAPVIVNVAGVGLGIMVQWSPASVDAGISSYSLTATPDTPSGTTVPSECDKDVTASAGASDTSATIAGVCANVAYQVTLTSTNSTGPSDASQPSNPVVPLPATAPTVPLIAGVTPQNMALDVVLSAPSYDGGEPVNGYLLTLTAGSRIRVFRLKASANRVAATRLINRTKYNLSLVATNAAGRSQAATAVGVPLPPHAPSPPQDLTVVAGSGRGSVNVSWAPPAQQGGSPMKSYLLTYQALIAKGKAGRVVYLKRGKATTRVSRSNSMSVHGLKRGKTFYEFKVAARNSKGRSPFTAYSQPTTVTTSMTRNSVVLRAPILDGLQSDVNGNLTWQYASDSAVPKLVSSLTPGEVLVGGISAPTPNGILASVTSVIHPAAGQYIVATRPASLADAFASADRAGRVRPRDSIGSQPALRPRRSRGTRFARQWDSRKPFRCRSTPFRRAPAVTCSAVTSASICRARLTLRHQAISRSTFTTDGMASRTALA